MFHNAHFQTSWSLHVCMNWLCYMQISNSIGRLSSYKTEIAWCLHNGKEITERIVSITQWIHLYTLLTSMHRLHYSLLFHLFTNHFSYNCCDRNKRFVNCTFFSIQIETYVSLPNQSEQQWEYSFLSILLWLISILWWFN